MEFEDQQHSGGNGTGPSYDSLSNSNSAHPRMPEDDDNGGGGGGDLPVTEPPLQMRKPRYRECQKNHAVGIGGHAVDGCGEFMPAGEYGTLDALKCAACNCHRNFHRKEINTAAALIPIGYHPHHHHRAPSGYLHHHHHHHAPLQRPLALPSISGSAYREEMEELDLDMDTATPNSGGGGSKGKRFRTKFTEVQKEKMVELAERLGWRIQKENEEAVEQFCNEYGVRRHVFKVWMHNNKHTVAKKTLEQNNNNNTTNQPDQDPPRI